MSFIDVPSPESITPTAIDQARITLGIPNEDFGLEAALTYARERLQPFTLAANRATAGVLLGGGIAEIGAPPGIRWDVVGQFRAVGTLAAMQAFGPVLEPHNLDTEVLCQVPKDRTTTSLIEVWHSRLQFWKEATRQAGQKPNRLVTVLTKRS